MTDFSLFNNDQLLATYSSVDNHLLVTDIIKGAVVFSSKTLLQGP